MKKCTKIIFVIVCFLPYSFKNRLLNYIENVYFKLNVLVGFSVIYTDRFLLTNSCIIYIHINEIIINYLNI